MTTTARLAIPLLLALAVSTLTGCFWHHDRDARDPPREDHHDDHHDDGDHHDPHHE
jgi:hypothetical protein